MKLEECKKSGAYDQILLKQYVKDFFKARPDLIFLNFVSSIMIKFKCNRCQKEHRVYITELKNFYCKECFRINQITNQCIDFAQKYDIEFVSLKGNFLKDGVSFRCKNNHIFELKYLGEAPICPKCEEERLNSLIEERKQELVSKIGNDYTIAGNINVTRVNDKTKIRCIHCKKEFNVSYAKVRDNSKIDPCSCKTAKPIKLNTNLSKNEWNERLKQINELCADKGKCLSTEIKCYKDKLKFLCYACGNIFYMNYASAKNGSWSCKCNHFHNTKHKLYSLKDYEQLGKKMNVEFVDTLPRHYLDQVKWRCKKHNEIFYKNYNEIKYGKIQCKQCVAEARMMSKRHSLEEHEKLASEVNCTFISKTLHEDEIWKCNACGHEFKMYYCHMKKRKDRNLVGCPECQKYLAHEKRRKTIDDYHQLSLTTNFTFIDKEIPPTINDLSKWKCNHGHEVLMSYNQVNRNNSCPDCKGNKSERICKEVLEDLLKIKLYLTRPNFLKRSDSNFPMELDMYNEKYKLAFEYQGIQHYEFRPFLQKTYENFLECQQHDKEKLELCKKEGIKLIQIKYFSSYKKRVTMKNIREYLQKIVEENHIVEWIKQHS